MRHSKCMPARKSKGRSSRSATQGMRARQQLQWQKQHHTGNACQIVLLLLLLRCKGNAAAAVTTAAVAAPYRCFCNWCCTLWACQHRTLPAHSSIYTKLFRTIHRHDCCMTQPLAVLARELQLPQLAHIKMPVLQRKAEHSLLYDALDHWNRESSQACFCELPANCEVL